MKRKARTRDRRDTPPKSHPTRAESHQVILDELAAAISGRKPKADFSDLAGRWTPDPAFDEIITSQRQIDMEKWK